jgi:hypothetical protein
MLQPLLAIYRHLTSRTRTSITQQAVLAPITLEERLVPTVAESMPMLLAPPMVQVGAPSIGGGVQVEVRTDLFGAGEPEPTDDNAEVWDDYVEAIEAQNQAEQDQPELVALPTDDVRDDS